MSYSDETPVDGVTPEPETGDDEVWSEADAAAVDAAASAGSESDESGAEESGDPMTVLTKERDEYLLALQRTQADFENYRKRIARQQEEQSARAAAALVNKVLPVLDTLDLAQVHQTEASAESDDAKALTAARSMLLDILTKEGLERVDQAEVPFDPSVHDAVSRTEGDDGEELIDQVLRSGYRWRGQVLRPAMVSVRG
ncbi:MAG TPA: nucleotide exchange factor GrpE [Acidimicrobiales bacterium]|jgi:molecular chaperone GrpE|nr:nucleotide exchange factor GrpE [Acidimicrobiales bacterium]